MKHLIAMLAAVLFSAPALAADVVATMTVKYNGQTIYSQTNSFIGLTDEQARALEKTAMANLDFASRRQSAKCGSACPYSIEWQWGSQPAVLTENHTFAQVNQILRQGVRWLDDRVTAAETNRQRGKGKPWG